MTDSYVASASVRPEPSDVEALAYSMANAKLGEGDTVRCEKPTGYEIEQARPWARRALYWMGERLSAARRQRDEDEARAIAALQRNLELSIAVGRLTDTLRREREAGLLIIDFMREKIASLESSGRSLADAHTNNKDQP